VERPTLFNEDGTRADLPQVSRANGLEEHFTETTDYKLRYVTAEGLAERYTLAGKERGDPEKMPKSHFHRAACGDEQTTLVKVHVRILLQPHEYFDSRTAFFMRTYGGTFDAALRRFDVRTCFTETTENQRLECDPAPSPPPPDNWVRPKCPSNPLDAQRPLLTIPRARMQVTPPSPPAYVYEALTLATATGSSALFFVISAVCCLGVGGRAIRARHTSRYIGDRDQRVDNMPYLPREYARHGQEPTGPIRPDYQQPGARLAAGTGFSFSGLTTRYDPVSMR
jgi:hypothetical protein